MFRYFCVRPQQVDMDCANMNFDNTIFAFTRIMWLANPTKTLSALVADWPCRAVLTEFVKTCSVVFEGHFEFFVQVRIPSWQSGPGKSRVVYNTIMLYGNFRMQSKHLKKILEDATRSGLYTPPLSPNTPPLLLNMFIVCSVGSSPEHARWRQGKSVEGYAPRHGSQPAFLLH